MKRLRFFVLAYSLVAAIGHYQTTKAEQQAPASAPAPGKKSAPMPGQNKRAWA